ncbi:3-dehydroquinate synthase [Hyphomonas sp.]|uniref:3-dehydroquinate synthase n=1 Tax=Hyphomonas sp. TaxID=87 RepID=UPI00356A43EE
MSDTSPEPEIVRVRLGDRSYDIVVGHGALSQLGARLAPLLKRKRVFVLTDESVARLHMGALDAALTPSGITTEVLALAPGEQSKSFSNLERILDWLLGAGADRSDILVAFGGGVIGDIAGLAASLMKRGMGFVQVPTTLLSQVDSSVGGKTAVNTSRGKNMIGAFYQPRFVIADTALLATLPARDLRAGYAEVLKYGLINDAAFFDWLEAHGADVLALAPDAIQHAVATSCRAKAAIVAEDETEGGVRALLNLGHTFGHAVEAANQYRPDVLHGEAVALGMVLAFRYGAAEGITSPDAAAKVARVIAASGLPVELGKVPGGPYEATELADLMKQDKKARGGQVPLILARAIGQSYIHPDADLKSVAAFLLGELEKA